jgi:hypothetical protein
MIVKYIANPKSISSKASRIGSLLDYIGSNARDAMQKVECISASGSFYAESMQGRRAEMVAVAMETKRSRDPIDHWLLSWKEGEQPTVMQCDQAVDVLKKHLGMNEEHLAVYALHRNTENYHLHVVLNRVDPTTFLVSDKGWCIDRAHKALAEIVHLQGWERETNSRYNVDRSGEIYVTSRSRERQPRSNARDKENATGEKSCERVAIEKATPILANATSWEQAHNDLNRVGMRYELKGSGALLWVNDQPVKASVIGREFSRKRMEERLGPFQSDDSRSITTEQAPRQVEALHGSNVELWPEYRKLIASHREDKESSQTQQRVMHRTQREAQAAIFCKERSGVYQNGKWSGAALSVARSLVASDHAKRKAQLSEQHKQERDVLRFQLGKRPTFEQFLIARGDQQLAKAWRYRQTHVEQAVLSGEGDEQPLKHDIRDFVANAQDRRNGVHYSKKDSQEISFTDQGRRIDVWRMSDEASVLAALQLGAQKWGTVTVTGPTEFKLLCAEIAVKHGIRINNPELQDALVNPMCATPSLVNEPNKSASPSSSYQSHKIDILNRMEVQNPSRLDWMIAVRMRVTGHSQEIIANMLKENAMVGRAAENRDWSNYADRTAEAVFGPRGDRECATNQPRAFAWANVEGRDLAREQVMQRQSAQKSVDRHRERGGMEIGD